MTQLITALEPHLFGMFAIFFRVGAFVGLLPGFGEAAVSVRIKLAMAIAFTFVIYPLVPAPTALTWTITNTAQIILAETLVGVLLGIGLRLLLLGLQTAGTIAAQSTSLSQVFGNAGVEPMPAMGHVLAVSGVALAMMAGLHVKVAILFVSSYDLFPFGGGVAGAGIAQWGTAQVAHAFKMAFSLAVPFVVLSMLYNLALGVINKAMPQLMVAFVGAPAITLGGMFLFFSAAPVMLGVWRETIEAYLINPMGQR